MDDSPICPAINPEKRACTRHAWNRNRLIVMMGIAPIEEKAPEVGNAGVVTFVSTGRNWVVSTPTAKRKTKNTRYTIAV